MVGALVLSHAAAQDPMALLRGADEAVYSPRQKGLKDLVIDLSQPGLTQRLNDQGVYGKLKDVLIRFYWTAEPERLDVEVLGLPEGFHEAKQELKAAMAGRFEALVPPPLQKKFATHQFKPYPGEPRRVLAVDSSRNSPVPEFELFFGDDGTPSKVLARRPAGTVTTTYEYGKEPWADPAKPLRKVRVVGVEGPLTTTLEAETSYALVGGIGLASSLKQSISQVLRASGPGSKPREDRQEEEMRFLNPQVNTGAAQRWFAGKAKSPAP